ncbi:hypothetical protein BLNAU_19343 [Blattamonas nauphoetae]|uniref:Uncharacterized protein n=1 Tax=Blattamonas nauphoetae TaxID=2049346 RepID=A0ABQ9X5Y1_9EUKA|nr:hypothetical protein BLNAU_19343 [Blattamonas nauphoetae]
MSEDSQTIVQTIRPPRDPLGVLCWTDLIEWFVEGVLCVNHLDTNQVTTPALILDKITIDDTPALRILICKRFLDFINVIETESCIIKLPPHPEHKVARLECVLWDLFLHFYESGDITIVNNFHVRHDNLDSAFADNTPLIVVFLAECISAANDIDNIRYDMVTEITTFFLAGVSQTCALGRLRVRDTSVLRAENTESSKLLQDIVMTVRKL